MYISLSASARALGLALLLSLSALIFKPLRLLFGPLFLFLLIVFWHSRRCRSHSMQVDSEFEKLESETSTRKPEGLVVIQNAISVERLADILHLPPYRLISELMSMEVFVTKADKIEFDIAATVALRHGMRVVREDADQPGEDQK